MPTRFIEAAYKKMAAAKLAVEDCQRNEPTNFEKATLLFRELSRATDEYVHAVDKYIAKTKSLQQNLSTHN
jgi:hypothetical protein